MALAITALLAGACLAKAASADGITFYLQLIQGTDAEAPPMAGATLVGDSLSRRLQAFRWSHYWELKRQTVQLTAGSKIRRRMTSQRDVEIAWTTPTNVTVCIYTEGKLTRKRVQPVDTAFYISGGDDNSAARSSWFIVVRRDKPQNAPATEARSPLGNPHQRPLRQLVEKRQQIAGG